MKAKLNNHKSKKKLNVRQVDYYLKHFKMM